MLKKPLCVAFLWHMHQPEYRKIQTGETCLPWTRFHAIKDYFDMAALAERAGNVHLTINLVPSLIDQLEAYRTDTAKEVQALLTLRDPSILSQHEKMFLLRTFFQLSPAHMLLPYPRYKELLDRRGSADQNGDFSTGLNLYSFQDYRDLQFWYNLTWCGPELRKDPEIAGFFEKGRGFTEEDKKRLLEIQNAFIGRILPYYRELAHSGAIEFSISPYYHPILPLLCDLRVAKEALPSVELPSEPFSYPQDAREQVERATKAYEQVFGRSAQGMWPSEGAISDAALNLAGEAGIRWLASDESVLWNSLHRNGIGGSLSPERKYRAYLWEGAGSGPCVFFRDHALSDLFGFSYYCWNEKDAVADFCGRLRRIHQSLPDDGRHYIVPVILDGENAWEHYPDNGSRFLSHLYDTLAKSTDLRTVTFSEFLDLESHREPLSSLVSGSWIYGNLATWIGHPEKNRAWQLMAPVRRLLSAAQLRTPNAPELRAAFNEMMIAEGSDWFWWFGDDHQTENAAEFDALFRGHLKSVYRLLGEVPPVTLDEPIKKTQPRVMYRQPIHTMTAQLDGQVTDYFEWISAGYGIAGGGDSMHRTDRLLEKVFFGFDLKYFYLRIDLVPGKISDFPAEGSVQVQFVSPVKCNLDLRFSQDHGWSLAQVSWPASNKAPVFAANRILELGLPLEALGVQKPEDVTFFVLVLENNRELERFPSSGFLTVPTDPWGLDQQEWIV
jgi:alpha-amylase/alpha-mannosidase (GH57 family)